jgi:HSP20 family protein
MFSLIPWRREGQGSRALALRDNPFSLLRQEFDTLFDRFFGDWPGAGNLAAGRGLDVEDKGTEFVVRAEAPGFEAGEFDVQLTGDRLHIRAEHKEEEKEGQATNQLFFERVVSLPGGAELDKVEARYRNGVLEVHLPKTKEALGRRIEVKS